MVDYGQLHYILAQKRPYATRCNINRAPWNIQSSGKPWYPQRLCLEDALERPGFCFSLTLGRQNILEDNLR